MKIIIKEAGFSQHALFETRNVLHLYFIQVVSIHSNKNWELLYMYVSAVRLCIKGFSVDIFNILLTWLDSDVNPFDHVDVYPVQHHFPWAPGVAEQLQSVGPPGLFTFTETWGNKVVSVQKKSAGRGTDPVSQSVWTGPDSHKSLVLTQISSKPPIRLKPGRSKRCSLQHSAASTKCHELVHAARCHPPRRIGHLEDCYRAHWQKDSVLETEAGLKDRGESWWEEETTFNYVSDAAEQALMQHANLKRCYKYNKGGRNVSETCSWGGTCRNIFNHGLACLVWVSLRWRTERNRVITGNLL